jgi:hypothetical protein
MPTRRIPASYRHLAPILALAVQLGCAQPPVQLTPSFAEALAWRQQSFINPAIDKRLEPEGILWGQWQTQGKLIVIEDDVPSIYQAMVVERFFDSLETSHPCRPAQTATLYAWRPRLDSTGIDALTVTVKRPLPGYGTAVGPRRLCPNQAVLLPPLLVYSIAGRSYFGSAEAVNGWVYLSSLPSRPGVPPIPCGDASSTEPNSCHRVGYTISSQGVLIRRKHSETNVALVINAGSIPGIRFRTNCRSPVNRDRCPGAGYTMRNALPPVDRYRPAFDTIKFVTTWKQQRVLRTEVFLRLDSTLTDSAKASLLDAHGIRATQQTQAGSLIADIPDPGPDPSFFEKTLKDLERSPGFGAVYPIAIASRLPVTAPGTVTVRVVDSTGNSLSGMYACWGGDPSIIPPPNCRLSDSGGKVRFPNLAVMDYTFYAACPAIAPERPQTFDSAHVAVRPQQRHELLLTRARGTCPEFTRIH